MPKQTDFLETQFFFVFIAENFWRDFWHNNWRSIFDVVERLCYNWRNCSCHFRDLTASAIYVLLYNNLLSEKEKDTKSIVMAGGVAGTTFLSISDKYLSDPALILYCKFCPSSFYHFNLHSIAKYFVTIVHQQVSKLLRDVLVK